MSTAGLNEVFIMSHKTVELTISIHWNSSFNCILDVNDDFLLHGSFGDGRHWLGVEQIVNGDVIL